MSIAKGPTRFKHWLRRQPDNKIIGYRGEIKFNPLSQYLQDKTGIDFGVTLHVFYKYKGCFARRGELPEWAKKLMKKLQDSGDPGTGIQARTVKKLMIDITNELKAAT